MKIVVTGATGLIGSHLVKELMKSQKNHIIAVSRSEEKLNKVFDTYSDSRNFESVALDMSHVFNFDKILGNKNNKPVDLIFHAASPISGTIIQKQPVDVINTNIFSTKILLDGICKQNRDYNSNSRIIIFSSATVYGQPKDTEMYCKEEDTFNADTLESNSSAYSESKRMVEVIARAYQRQYNIDVVIARISYVYGNAFYPPMTAMFSFIKDVLVKNENIFLEKSDLGRRDNIYIDDVINALVLISKEGKTGESYNISSDGMLGNYLAIDEIAELIVEKINCLTKKNYQVLYTVPQTNKRKPGVRICNDKIACLGWKPCISFEDGLFSIIKEYNAL